MVMSNFYRYDLLIHLTISWSVEYMTIWHKPLLDVSITFYITPRTAVISRVSCHRSMFNDMQNKTISLWMLHVPLPRQKPQSNNGQSIFQINRTFDQQEPLWMEHGHVIFWITHRRTSRVYESLLAMKCGCAEDLFIPGRKRKRFSLLKCLLIVGKCKTICVSLLWGIQPR